MREAIEMNSIQMVAHSLYHQDPSREMEIGARCAYCHSSANLTPLGTGFWCMICGNVADQTGIPCQICLGTFHG